MFPAPIFGALILTASLAGYLMLSTVIADIGALIGPFHGCALYADGWILAIAVGMFNRARQPAPGSSGMI